MSLLEGKELSENTEVKKRGRKPKPAITTSKISATSSITINLGNYNSARVEFTMEKTINDESKINLEEEKEKLWNEINAEVDKQAQDIRDSLK